MKELLPGKFYYFWWSNLTVKIVFLHKSVKHKADTWTSVPIDYYDSLKSDLIKLLHVITLDYFFNILVLSVCTLDEIIRKSSDKKISRIFYLTISGILGE